MLRENGRTAFESVTGHRCPQPSFMFGENVMFPLAPAKTNMMKAKYHWHVGMLIGVDSGSQEYLLMNTSGLYNCRSMQRMSRDKAFNGECLEEAKFGLEIYTSTQVPGQRSSRTRGSWRAPEKMEARRLCPQEPKCNACRFRQRRLHRWLQRLCMAARPSRWKGRTQR